MNESKLLKAVVAMAFSMLLVTMSGYGESTLELEGDSKFIKINVIPKLKEVTLSGSSFILKPKTRIYAMSGSDEIRDIAKYFADQIRPATGFKISIRKSDKSAPPTGSILFTTKLADKTLGAEGYELIIKPESILVRAPHPAGLFYAVQTLRQLLPVQIESEQKVDTVAWNIPCGRISDKPRFPWRSLMLDSVRHFQTKEFIKRYIDLLAYHKMNRFHWHLTDDQGWRIEIKKYPKLTEIGAWRGKGKNRSNGGFYTQRDIREVVAYAKSRYVTIIPEIEMPSHATATLFCYPQLSCTGGPFEAGSDGLGYYTDKNGWRVYCAGNEQVFEFLTDVLTEVMDMFDTPYVHIGGEELRKDAWVDCPKCQAKIKELGLADENELHNWLMTRISKFIVDHNRRPMAYSDKNMNHGIPENQIVQGWHSGWVKFATERGFEAIRSVHSIFYLNYPASEEERATHGHLDWMTTNTLEKIYTSDPIPDGLTAEQAELVIGGEVPLWTELVTQERVDEKVFPRLTAMAEILWSPIRHRDFVDFSSRLDVHYKRLDELGVNYLRPPNKE